MGAAEITFLLFAATICAIWSASANRVQYKIKVSTKLSTQLDYSFTKRQRNMEICFKFSSPIHSSLQNTLTIYQSNHQLRHRLFSFPSFTSKPQISNTLCNKLKSYKLFRSLIQCSRCYINFLVAPSCNPPISNLFTTKDPVVSGALFQDTDSHHNWGVY